MGDSSATKPSADTIGEYLGDSVIGPALIQVGDATHLSRGPNRIRIRLRKGRHPFCAWNGQPVEHFPTSRSSPKMASPDEVRESARKRPVGDRTLGGANGLLEIGITKR